MFLTLSPGIPLLELMLGWRLLVVTFWLLETGRSGYSTSSPSTSRGGGAGNGS